MVSETDLERLLFTAFQEICLARLIKADRMMFVVEEYREMWYSDSDIREAVSNAESPSDDVLTRQLKSCRHVRQCPVPGTWWIRASSVAYLKEIDLSSDSKSDEVAE